MIQELLTLCAWLKDITVLLIAILSLALIQLLALRKLQGRKVQRNRKLNHG